MGERDGQLSIRVLRSRQKGADRRGEDKESKVKARDRSKTEV